MVPKAMLRRESLRKIEIYVRYLRLIIYKDKIAKILE